VNGATGPVPRLRLLVVSNMYPTAEEPWYGSFVRDQVDDLRAEGIDVRLLHFDGRRDALNYLRAALALRRVVRRERFDLVHAHYGLTGAVALVQRRLPGITTFHGSDYTGEVRWQRYVSRLVARLTVPVVVSAAGRRALGAPSARVVPAGVDTELFVPMRRDAARERLGWDARGRYALLLGARSVPVKRADLFAAVVREAGRAVPGLEGVSLDGIARSEMPFVMNAADVGVLTSDSEGSPIAVREALACSTPVVSVDVGDVAEVLRGLPGCGIFPRNVAALAGGVEEALRAGRSEELRARAAETSRKRIAERLVALYEDLLRARRRPLPA
jgi:glycosyltransferase involved in cell wall biosynthesis